MSGAVLQLYRHGTQDAFISKNPKDSLWKIMYNKCTNFSTQTIPLLFLGNVQSEEVSSTILRHGDMINKMYLEFTMKEFEMKGLDEVYSLISSIKLEIGGGLIDEYDGNWIKCLHQLFTTNDKFTYLKKMMNVENNIIQIPLDFYFCKHSGLSIPLIALQKHRIRILLKTNSQKIRSVKLLVNYVYLDKVEQKRVECSKHTYLISQVQKRTIPIKNLQPNELTFFHPVKELIWMLRTQDDTKNVDFDTAGITLNKFNRLSPMSKYFFRYTQPYEHHTRIPTENIYVYSFALYPEDVLQPSGCYNFSHDNSGYLTINSEDDNISDAVLQIYAPNWNILEIENGICKLLYSN